VVFMFQTDGLAAVLAKLRADKIERAATMTKRFAVSQRVHLDRRTAVLTVRAKIVQTFEASAFALPVTDLVLDEVERGSAAEVGDWKNRLKDGLETGSFTLFRQQVHLQKSVIRLALNLNKIWYPDGGGDLGEVLTLR